jgi:hypothetical protein
MKRLSARAPDLDIFSSRYVLRDEAGWQLTEAGQAFLASIETSAPATSHEIGALEVIVTVQVPARQSPGRRRTRGKDRANTYKLA